MKLTQTQRKYIRHNSKLEPEQKEEILKKLTGSSIDFTGVEFDYSYNYETVDVLFKYNLDIDRYFNSIVYILKHLQLIGLEVGTDYELCDILLSKTKEEIVLRKNEGIDDEVDKIEREIETLKSKQEKLSQETNSDEEELDNLLMQL